jgi:ferrous iron transport protein A
MTQDSLPSARLSEARMGARGAVTGLAIEPGDMSHGVTPDELERRLLEIGFVEGAKFEVLHLGLIGADPIAIRLNDTRIALRKREAAAILVTMEPA